MMCIVSSVGGIPPLAFRASYLRDDALGFRRLSLRFQVPLHLN
jgi:hypothetical protein